VHVLTLAGLLIAPAAHAQAIVRGVVTDPVSCTEAPSQTYALYVPSTYTPDRPWSVLLAFHPAARGRQLVEKYQAAAERYGYIVAASNNARNGPHAVSAAAAQAMGADVSRRFAIDPKRIYLTGFSGGARVSLALALGNDAIAGVIVSGAGYLDSRPRQKVNFVIFGTAGVEDFNYLEMREMDRALSSPHFLAIFPGGHTLPPDDLALDAIEWLEVQAMQSGRRSRDEAVARAILERRRARLEAATSSVERVYLLDAIVRDFTGLLDVTSETRRLEALKRDREVRSALDRDRDLHRDEARWLDEMLTFEAQLDDPERRQVALMTLNERLGRLWKKATAEGDTPERMQARRLLRVMAAGAGERTADKDYLAIVERYSLPRR
jgi:dienelactone hydrolase